MSKYAKPKTYFEPWTAKRSPTWEASFKSEPPAPRTCNPEEQADADRSWRWDWLAAKARAEANSPFLIWGTGLDSPTVASTLLGTPTVIDDMGIVATITKHTSWPTVGPGHEEVAKRIAACVSACAGIADPVKFITDVRALLLAQAKSEYEDPRVLALLARCISPNQFEEQFSDNDDL